jgi:oligoendopeptidase F
MNLDNEIDEKIVTALIETVKNRYDIPQRYYRLKKNCLDTMNFSITTGTAHCLSPRKRR